MEFFLRNATRAEHFQALKVLHAAGVNVPSVAEAPEIIPPYVWLWQGFCLLSSRRLRSGSSGQPQHIQVTEIKGFVDFHGITEEVRRSLFFNVVTALDDVFIADYWKKMKDAETKRKLKAHR